MKHLNKIVATVLAGSMLTACADLDIQPEGSTITEQQKEEVASVDPEKLFASVSGIPALLIAVGGLTGDTQNYQFDFGFPSLMIQFDIRGMDMYSINSGYNWFRSSQTWGDCIVNSQFGYNPWGLNYDLIRACNALLATALPAIDPEATDETTQTQKFYAAQGLAFRAYAYLYLVQAYQFTYAVNKDAAAVPVLTEENQNEAAVNGCPNSTVEEVYEQIMSDLNKAIDFMTGNPVTASSVLDAKANRMFDLNAAYGLRARANLLMNKWAEAAADAQSAIDNFKGAPLSAEEAAVPGFNSCNAKNWMLGMAVAETDNCVRTGIVNFPSMMGSFSYGYATAVGAFKWINQKLYATIAETDVRRGWWLDEAGTSVNLTPAQQAYVESISATAGVQVKFAPYNGVIDTDVNASDIPMMRVEEMYYIKAEAEGMQTLATGVATLNDFVKTYRDPAYKFSASDTQAFRDEIWRQRRIEFWGEGLSYFDMLRLQKDMDRRGGGWPAANIFFVKADDWAMVYPTPQAETQTNKALVVNHPNGTTPQPVSNN